MFIGPNAHELTEEKKYQSGKWTNRRIELVLEWMSVERKMTSNCYHFFCISSRYFFSSFLSLPLPRSLPFSISCSRSFPSAFVDTLLLYACSSSLLTNRCSIDGKKSSESVIFSRMFDYFFTIREEKQKDCQIFSSLHQRWSFLLLKPFDTDGKHWNEILWWEEENDRINSTINFCQAKKKEEETRSARIIKLLLYLFVPMPCWIIDAFRNVTLLLLFGSWWRFD